MNQELKKLLKQGLARTRRQGMIVGLITLGIASLMTALYWLDAEMATYGLAMKILYGFVTLFFHITALFIFYIAIHKNSLQQAEIFHTLEANPNALQKVYHFQVASRASNQSAANPVGAQNYVRIEYKNGAIIQLSYPHEKIPVVLELIYKIAPHTRVNPQTMKTPAPMAV